MIFIKLNLPELLVGVLDEAVLAESVSVTDNIKAGRLAGDLLGIGAIICKIIIIMKDK